MDQENNGATAEPECSSATDKDGQSPSSPIDSSEHIKFDENRIVKHIMVIGFHHKHGYQVDYCYPPLTPDGPVFSTPTNVITLPSCWKTLPLLCLPDGSHNYDSDTIYFTMPDAEHIAATSSHSSATPNDPSGGEQSTSGIVNSTEGIKTIFGTACYRQIQVDKLLNRTDDMTRLSVQKSVCVLSSQPLFGLIRSKLEMITHAYFEELDFSKVRILKLTYDNFNSLLSRESIRENATFLGLSARHLINYFDCNMLVLFKAMLLEKKILFYKSPVRDLSSTIMSMCSLFPGLLECNGLDYSTCDLQLSPTMLEALKLLPSPTAIPSDAENCDSNQSNQEGRVFFSPSKEEVVIINNSIMSLDNIDEKDHDHPILNELNSESISAAQLPLNDEKKSSSVRENNKTTKNNQESSNHQLNVQSQQTGEFEIFNHSQIAEEAMEYESNVNTNETIIDDPYAHKLCQMKPEECGLPLQIFTRGSFCLPYLSISYLDLLSDTRVRSFVIGATNFLFKQRREMYDVIVDMEENSIIISDPNLKKCLSLTIEDLRFMDYLIRHVKSDSSASSNRNTSDSFDPMNQHDVTKWVGGDEWIRYHFKIYTLYLLKAVKTTNNSMNGNLEAFNASFVQAWKQTTNNYRIWNQTQQSNKSISNLLDRLQAKHPFRSNVKGINFSDMKLKLSYAVNSSERGRIVNQTLNGIGKWSIWNNIASAGNMAASTVSTLASSAAAAATATSTSVTTASGLGDNNGKQSSRPEDI